MRRFYYSLIVSGLLALAVPAQVGAQDAPDWRPPSTAMPTMPTMAELQGDWMSSLGAWFRGIDRVTGASAGALRASGTPRSGSAHTQIARFTQGPVPVVVMTDRNGDDRADMVELYRSGRVVIQVIDADYNGQANVLRVYDAAGALLREERL